MGQAAPFVTVVIPAWNAAATLPRCLDAVLKQSFPQAQYEVVVVDNGSRDETSRIALEYPRVRLVREDQPGSYAARNRGVREAAGEILAFTDADAVPERDWLERSMAALRAAGGRACIAGAVELTWDASAPTAVELVEATVAHPFPQQRFADQSHFGATVNLLVPRAAFETVGPFDARLRSGGDLEWGRRARQAGIAVSYAPDARVQHPARRTWRALARRARRLTGGAHDRARVAGQRAWRRLLLDTYQDLALAAAHRRRRYGFASTPALGRALLWVPLSLIPDVWTDPRLARCSRWDKLRVLAVLAYWRWIRSAERLRLLLGGRSVR
jgi:glycosyltransferase involved in cell wall biosynthesis